MSDMTRVSDAPARDMIALRGDLSDPSLRAVVAEVTGAAMPDPLRITMAGEGAVAWMSPDELLLFVPVGQGQSACTRIGAALAGRHHLAMDVSDMRIALRLSGSYAREVLAKVVPVDMSPGAFDVGSFRRTRVGQVAAAVWLDGDGSFTVIAFRSVGEYLQALLNQSARDGAVGIW